MTLGKQPELVIVEFESEAVVRPNVNRVVGVNIKYRNVALLEQFTAM